MKKLMVALVTPFTRDNKVDYKSMDRILHRLLKEGCDGFIVCGTTAETPTLSHNEKLSILRHVIKRVKHRAEIWYGCGSNDTAATILACREAQKEAIDGVLLVTPYYSKPNAAGLYAHFDALASAVDTNIMLYNVPARTGVELTYETIHALLEKHKNITALKQACSNLDMVRRLKQQHPDFLIHSGEDGFFDEGFDAGMDGLVSVMGHVCMKELRTFCDDERVDNRLRRRLYELAALTFTEASPAPVKYMLHLQDECENILRLPMVAVSEAAENRIQEYFTKYRHRLED